MLPKEGDAVRVFTEQGLGNVGTVEKVKTVLTTSVPQTIGGAVPRTAVGAYRTTIATIRMLNGVVLTADCRALMAITPLEVLADLPDPS